MILPNVKGVMVAFFDRDSKESLITTVGYDNFNYVTPSKLFRRQPYYTLHIVIEGSGILKFKNKVYEITKGDMFFLPPDASFCYYPSEEDPWQYTWFGLDGEDAAYYGEKLGFSNENPVRKCHNFNNICMLLEHILTKKIKQIPVGYYDALSTFFKVIDYNTRDDENKNINLPDAIADYIKYSYNKVDLTIQEICDFFNISHSYLCRIFKESYDCSVKNYLMRVRLNEACRLLEATRLGVKEIAFSVGFSDEIHFMKTFKKHTDKTPTEFRKQATIHA